MTKGQEIAATFTTSASTRADLASCIDAAIVEAIAERPDPMWECNIPEHGKCAELCFECCLGLVNEAITEEREACARVARAEGCDYAGCGVRVPRAIRARGSKS